MAQRLPTFSRCKQLATSRWLQAPAAKLALLVQVVLFHEHACEALSDDAVLELCDWCCRKALALQRSPRSSGTSGGPELQLSATYCRAC